MKHFSDEDWLDYARRLLPADQHQRMESHVSSGCARCTKLLAIWKAVHQTGSRLSQDDPPDAAVRAVKAAFGQRRTQDAPLEIRFAALLFDSFVNAPLAAVRSGSSTARHLLYQVETWTIDLRVEEDGERVTIDGQVLDSTAGGGPALAGEITLMRGESEQSRTSTNEFGEFQLVGAGATDLQIHVEIPGQRPIRIRIPD
jgi:hypothetical protein